MKFMRFAFVVLRLAYLLYLPSNLCCGFCRQFLLFFILQSSSQDFFNNFADQIEEKLEKTEAQTKKALEEASENAKNILAEAKNEAQRINEQALLEARKTQEEALASTKVQIEMQKEEMKKQLEVENLTLVVEVVKKVLGRTLKDKEKQELTAKAAAEIGRQIQ